MKNKGLVVVYTVKNILCTNLPKEDRTKDENTVSHRSINYNELNLILFNIPFFNFLFITVFYLNLPYFIKGQIYWDTEDLNFFSYVILFLQILLTIEKNTYTTKSTPTLSRFTSWVCPSSSMFPSRIPTLSLVYVSKNNRTFSYPPSTLIMHEHTKQ